MGENRCKLFAANRNNNQKSTVMSDKEITLQSAIHVSRTEMLEEEKKAYTAHMSSIEAQIQEIRENAVTNMMIATLSKMSVAELTILLNNRFQNGTVSGIVKEKKAEIDKLRDELRTYLASYITEKALSSYTTDEEKVQFLAKVAMPKPTKRRGRKKAEQKAE